MSFFRPFPTIVLLKNVFFSFQFKVQYQKTSQLFFRVQEAEVRGGLNFVSKDQLNLSEIKSNWISFVADSKFSRIPQIEVNLENDGKRVRSEFDSFLSSIVENLTARHEQEEINIMNMRS